MKKASILLSATMLFGCQGLDNTDKGKTSQMPTKVALTEEQEEYVSAGNDLTFTIFNSCCNDTSCIFCPISIQTMLGMMLNVVEEKDGIFTLLGYGDGDVNIVNEHLYSLKGQLEKLTDKVKFSSANLFASKDDYPDAEKALRKYYSAECMKISGTEEETSMLDEWVSSATNGMIPCMKLGHEMMSARWIVCNAQYFNGTWGKTYFEKENTSAGEFHKLDGTEKSVEMMKNKTEFFYMEKERFKALRLNYGLGEFCMTLILPTNAEDFISLSHSFNNKDWELIQSCLYPADVDVAIPKFTISTAGNLNEALEAAIGNPYISTWSEAVIKVSEEGTTVASTSQGGIYVTEPLSDPTFIADRPFIFVISESSSKAIVHIGQYCG